MTSPQEQFFQYIDDNTNTEDFIERLTKAVEIPRCCFLPVHFSSCVHILGYQRKRSGVSSKEGSVHGHLA